MRIFTTGGTSEAPGVVPAPLQRGGIKPQFFPIEGGPLPIKNLWVCFTPLRFG